MCLKWTLVVFLIILRYSSLYRADDQVNEELFIETLQNADLNVYFQFTVVSDKNINNKTSCL